MKKQRFVFILTMLLALFCNVLAAQQNPFPQPKALDPDVEFWKRVYTEINTSQGFIHDAKNLAVVYESIKIPKNYSRKARHRYVKKVKQKYNNILKKLASGKRNKLSKNEKRVLALWPAGVSNRTLRAATKRIRFQLGQSNKFRAGLIRSGSWKPYILKTLDRMGLPEEIAALPHVESSFNHKAYSKVGAAGMWQFMRSTGRRFMRVDHVVDERMDPFKATVAAARLLENNYAVTGSWPLALIAYNHGAAGMRRAARKMGTTDIVPILRNYRSRTFKFASRNFYVAFLAAVEIDKNPSKYFGPLTLAPEVDYEFIKLPGYMSVDSVIKTLKIARNNLMETNPALRPSVWNGNKYVPKNYELRINKRHIRQGSFTKTALAQLSSHEYFSKQKPDLYHRVRRGQTLSTIAARYGVRVRDIVALNNLRNKHSIRSGQSLRLPQPGKHRKKQPTQVAESRPPKIEPVSIPESGIYRVRRGDTLGRIAKKYGLHAREILALNNLRNKHRIYPGQKLIVAPQQPEKQNTLASNAIIKVNAETNVYRVRRGDTVERIANKHRMHPNELLSLNNIRNKNRIYPGQKLIIAHAEPAPLTSKKSALAALPAPITGENIYKVRRGDTLERIAKRHGVEPDEILSLNKLRNKNRIYPGQKLILAQAAPTTPLALEQTQDSLPSDTESTTTTPETQTAQTDRAPFDPVANMQPHAIDTSTSQELTPPEESIISIDSENQSQQPSIVVADLQGQDLTEPDSHDMSSTEPATEGDNSSEDEASLDKPDESIGGNVTSDSESEIIADPSDYSVAKNNTIEVQAAETLGHYAEWLNLRASRLRRVNHMRYGKPVVVGKRLKLDFSKITPEHFEEQRIAYHRTLQEEFFEQFQISGSERHKIRRGESIWKLAKRKYKIPIWLLRQYNPDLDFDRVRHGTYVTFPTVEKRREENSANTDDENLNNPNQTPITETIAEAIEGT
ncbi:MAG: LysM peptidoglycan-binding domain-containing protein [Gammaproteobacteria bacterium]|nr:LysM peptidoglycan-binding domain-containing protein [Gammaproteobacteria bacterium]